VSDYRIDSTSEADAHALAIDSWWRDHRPASPDVFLSELTRAFKLLARVPALGATYDHPGAPPNVRRLLMRSTRTHVYYTVDQTARVVLVRAIWHASRGPARFGTP
jgi:hypothetical protein